MSYFGTNKKAKNQEVATIARKGGKCENKKKEEYLTQGIHTQTLSAWMSRNTSAFCVTKRVVFLPPTPTHATWEASKKSLFLFLNRQDFVG
jgi:hypothetical protein